MLSSRDSAKARVFSLLHEVGHVLLGQSAISMVWGSGDAVERFCNRLAAEVLLPEADIRADSLVARLHGRQAGREDLRELSRKYWVSMYAVAVRLCELGLQPRSILAGWRSKQYEPAAGAEPGEGGPSYYTTQVSHLGAPLLSTTFRASDEGLISLVEAARILGMKARNLEKLRERL